MAREFAKKFYKSKEWQNVRNLVKCRALGICEICEKAKGKEVHHLVHLNEWNINNPDITLNQAKLVLLCRDCHAKIHNSVNGKFIHEFDDEGNLINIIDVEEKILRNIDRYNYSLKIK